jgi:hypothetical protein
MSATTPYRVVLRHAPTFSKVRGEWRLCVRSTRDFVGAKNYTIFVDVESRPELDARCIGLRLASAEGLTLLVDAKRRLRDGKERAYAVALLVLPATIQAAADDDIFSAWAEWRSLLVRFPELTAAEGAATIASLFDGVVEGLTASAVEALINHNHAPL